jgi:hypothetical protein
MSYDPRRQRVNTVLAALTANRYALNKNPMLKVLFEEVGRLQKENADLASQIESFKKAPKPKRNDSPSE